jgi:hypothetical protein
VEVSRIGGQIASGVRDSGVAMTARVLFVALAGWLLAATGGYAQSPPGPNSALGEAAEPRRTTWAPPDIDESIPPVDPGAKCALPEVLQAAGARLKELVANVEKFTATERIEYVEVTRNGKTIQRKTGAFDYVVSLSEIRPGMLTAEEFRNGREGPQLFFMDLATNGLPALVLIFHPYYVGDFEMSCEGLGGVDGEPAWQVHFRQRPDRPSRMYSLYIGDRRFPLALKGRGWISVRNSQILRLEVDIVEPVKGAGLHRSHKIVEYQPVHFEKQKVDLWLPARAEVYMDFRGHCYQIRHAFSEFLLFDVTTKQQIAGPRPPDGKLE